MDDGPTKGGRLRRLARWAAHLVTPRPPSWTTYRLDLDAPRPPGRLVRYICETCYGFGVVRPPGGEFERCPSCRGVAPTRLLEVDLTRSPPA